MSFSSLPVNGRKSTNPGLEVSQRSELSSLGDALSPLLWKVSGMVRTGVARQRGKEVA